MELVVLAWGYSQKIGPRMLTRAWEVRKLLREELAAMGDRAPRVGHLGLTKGKEKQPLHPLRLRADTPLTALRL